MGKFDKDNCKPRTLLLTIVIEYDVRLLLARGVEKQEMLIQQNVFLLPVLSNDNSYKENMCMEKRRKLMDAGVTKDKLKIRNLKFVFDCVKVELPRKSAEPNQHDY